jgi:tetratricopeptide (TPR) repeat protein
MAFTGEVVRRGNVHQNVHLLIVLAFVVGVFGASIDFDFVWDDHVLLIGHDVYASFDLGRIFFSLANQVEYLPIRDVSYAVDYALWGENPFGFHLTNLTLYFLNAVFVYLMTLRLTPLLFSARRPMSERRAGEVALLTTLLFAIHPIHSEPVSFISCRNVLLSGLFSFMSCHFFLKHLGGTDGQARGSYAVSLLCCVLAILSKATAVVLPGVLLLFAAFDGRPWRKTLPPLAPFVALSAAAVIFFKTVATQAGLINPDQFIVFGSLSFGTRLAVAVQIPFFYLGKLALPTGLSALYDTRFSSDLDDPTVLLCMLALTGAFALGISLRNRYPGLLFAMGWYLVALFPVLGFFTTSTVVADRYAYLPSYSFVYLAVTTSILALSKIPPIAIRSLAAAAVVALSFMAFERNGVWSSDETLWEDTIAVSPGAWKAYINLGAHYFDRGEYEQAFRLFERLAEQRQNDGPLRFFKAQYALQQGNHTEVIELLEGISLGGVDPMRISLLLGQAYEGSEKIQKAIDSYADALQKGGHARNEAMFTARNRLEKLQAKILPRLEGQRRALRENPSDLNARAKLAIALDQAGLYEEALHHYAELLRRGGTNWSLHYNMGNAYRKLERYEAAAQSYEKSISMNPDHPQTHNNLGVTWKMLHEYDRAIRAFEAAMRLDPNFKNPSFNLATLYFRLGDKQNATRAFDRAVRSFPELQSQANPYLEALE